MPEQVQNLRDRRMAAERALPGRLRLRVAPVLLTGPRAFLQRRNARKHSRVGQQRDYSFREGRNSERQP